MARFVLSQQEPAVAACENTTPHCYNVYQDDAVITVPISIIELDIVDGK